MRSKLSFGAFCLIVLLALSGGGCKKREVKSLTQLLKEEKTYIRDFIAKEGFTVKEASGEETTFEANILYHFPNGLYMQVLDAGKTRPEVNKTKVVVRFAGYMFQKEPLSSFNNLTDGSYQNTEFLYIESYNRGALHYSLLPSAPGYTLNSLMCEGLAFPMSLLGDGARVRLIIPFLLGPEVAYNTGTPMYCQEAQYEFSKP